MDTIWIVVAHHAGARLFERTRPKLGIRRIKTWDHPEGRLHDRDRVTDRPGRLFGGTGQRKHGLFPLTDPGEHDAEMFSIQIAREIDEARARREFDFLVLVADPQMLGLLRSHLPAPTKKVVIHSVAKNLAHFEDRDVATHLDGKLHEIDQDLSLPRSTA